jgi:hypothetical protein
MPLTEQQLAEFRRRVVAERVAAGLPPKIADPDILSRIAVVLALVAPGV